MDGSENPQAGLGLPPDFPYPWCSDYGEDEYGIFMAFTYRDIRQGFRWIPPGTFWMGSPKGEVRRRSSPRGESGETLHQVTLTRGYWLAETTCTQELWQAVMGENPSGFREKLRPVENVNWNRTKQFIRVLNASRPELALRLPSEAEWERACRAGTQDAFWFGERIDERRVRCRKDSVLGTIPAKALEANPWGLYQMHGNVEEWCEDWLGSYPNHAVINPLGPTSGQRRVFRGGSWYSSGNYCRAAYRDGDPPAVSCRYVGFRLARGQ